MAQKQFFWPKQHFWAKKCPRWETPGRCLESQVQESQELPSHLASAASARLQGERRAGGRRPGPEGGRQGEASSNLGATRREGGPAEAASGYRAEIRGARAGPPCPTSPGWTRRGRDHESHLLYQAGEVSRRGPRGRAGAPAGAAGSPGSAGWRPVGGGSGPGPATLFSSSLFLHGRGLNDGLANETNDSPDGELEVPGDDARLLVVACGVTGQLEDLGGQVLHHGGHVDKGAGSHGSHREEGVEGGQLGGAWVERRPTRD